MERILVKAELERKLKRVGLPEVIALYARCRSFAQIANAYHLHRPDIRRAMSQASKHLLRGDDLGSKDSYHHHSTYASKIPTATPEEAALGAYIFCLIDKASPDGQGVSKRERAKTARCVVLGDPPIVGKFRVDCKDPDFDALFVSRANR